MGQNQRALPLPHPQFHWPTVGYPEGDQAPHRHRSSEPDLGPQPAISVGDLQRRLGDRLLRGTRRSDMSWSSAGVCLQAFPARAGQSPTRWERRPSPSLWVVDPRAP